MTGVQTCALPICSQNSAIVRISEDGTITGRDVGKTVIKAIAGKKSAEMVVNVVENPDATVHDPTKDTGNAPEEGTEPPDTGTAGSGSGTGSSGTGTGTGTGTGSGGSSGTGTGSGSSGSGSGSGSSGGTGSGDGTGGTGGDSGGGAGTGQ